MQNPWIQCRPMNYEVVCVCLFTVADGNTNLSQPCVSPKDVSFCSFTSSFSEFQGTLWNYLDSVSSHTCAGQYSTEGSRREFWEPWAGSSISGGVCPHSCISPVNPVHLDLPGPAARPPLRVTVRLHLGSLSLQSAQAVSWGNSAIPLICFPSLSLTNILHLLMLKVQEPSFHIVCSGFELSQHAG